MQYKKINEDMFSQNIFFQISLPHKILLMP